MHFISKNIKALRLERGWTQQEMADLLFVTRQTVSNWENGKALPDVETLLQIAEKLNIDVNELVYGKRQPDERLKKDVVTSLIRLTVLYICQNILSIVNQKYLSPNFITSGMHLYYFTIDPLKLFFSGMLLIQLLKSCGVIKKCKGSKYLKIYKYIFMAVFALFSIAPFASYRIDFIILLFNLKIGQFANLDYFSSADYAIMLPQWITNIRDFLVTIALSGSKFYKPPYYLIFCAMGIVYEFAKPYRRESNLQNIYTARDAVQQIKNVIKNPDIHIKRLVYNCRKTFEFITTKSPFIRHSALALAVLYLLEILTGKHTTLFRKWIHMGITAPLTFFVAGIIIAIFFKRHITVYKTDGFRLRKLVLALSAGLLAVSLLVFIPEILRAATLLLDRAGIITVTGTYDITGWVLTPPLWFDRLHEAFTKINTSSKIWWWAVAGFICEATKPYHGKEKYNTAK